MHFSVALLGPVEQAAVLLFSSFFCWLRTSQVDFAPFPSVMRLCKCRSRLHGVESQKITIFGRTHTHEWRPRGSKGGLELLGISFLRSLTHAGCAGHIRSPLALLLLLLLLCSGHLFFMLLAQYDERCSVRRQQAQATFLYPGGLENLI